MKAFNKTLWRFFYQYFHMIHVYFSRYHGGGFTEHAWVRRLYGGRWVRLELNEKLHCWIDERIFDRQRINSRWFNVTKREGKSKLTCGKVGG